MRARGLLLVSSALAALAVVAAPSPAIAGLLDEPPRVLPTRLGTGDDALPLLRRFHDASVDRLGPTRLYAAGAWGQWQARPWWSLTWSPGPGLEGLADGPPVDRPEGDFVDAADDDPALSFDVLGTCDRPLAATFGLGDGAALCPAGHERRSPFAFTPPSEGWFAAANPDWLPTRIASTGPTLLSNGFDGLFAPKAEPVPWWAKCRRGQVTFVRYGAERASFDLVGCDGSVAPTALDRLSMMARPPGVAAPGELLPDEPDAVAWAASGEWLPGIKPVHPRLLWLMQRVAEAFPRRPIYIFSGYRPRPDKPNGHHSMHHEARALDVKVMGVPNEQLFKFCRTLDDAGCGYYPNSKFVHIDVRKPGTGHAYWVDASGPGEPARYVDGWPGVVEGSQWGLGTGANQGVAAPADPVVLRPIE